MTIDRAVGDAAATIALTVGSIVFLSVFVGAMLGRWVELSPPRAERT
jgi:hypothetical protein